MCSVRYKILKISYTKEARKQKFVWLHRIQGCVQGDLNFDIEIVFSGFRKMVLVCLSTDFLRVTAGWHKQHCKVFRSSPPLFRAVVFLHSRVPRNFGHLFDAPSIPPHPTYSTHKSVWFSCLTFWICFQTRIWRLRFKMDSWGVKRVAVFLLASCLGSHAGLTFQVTPNASRFSD